MTREAADTEERLHNSGPTKHPLTVQCAQYCTALCTILNTSVHCTELHCTVNKRYFWHAVSGGGGGIQQNRTDCLNDRGHSAGSREGTIVNKQTQEEQTVSRAGSYVNN